MFAVTSFYQFLAQTDNDVTARQQFFMEFGEAHGLSGLIIIGNEGINGTVAGLPESILLLKEKLEELFPSIDYKDSTADTQPFKRWFVKVRNEIVSLGKADVCPEDSEHRHLEPEEWQRALEEEDVILLDTRNDYETEIGVFEGAIDPKIEKFSDFPAYVQAANLPKDKKILMYCTGGIRCEKAILEMEQQGYTNVFQLKGGILKYLEQFPYQKFKGECFVFDHRTAVSQDLKPSDRYQLCPLSGDPADCDIVCTKCGTETKIHKNCAAEGRLFCSKNCENSYAFQLRKATAEARK